MQTPILIQYGQDDEVVFPSQTGLAFVALRSLKKTAILVGYAGEGHSLGKPENEIDFFNRTIAWFDKYVKGDGPQQDLTTDDLSPHVVECSLRYLDPS